MNRTPLILAALLPLAAAAGDSGSLQKQIDIEKLQEDVRASALIGADASTPGGEQSGSVEDIEISADGRIEALLVEGLEASGAEQGGTQRVNAGEETGAANASATVGTPTNEGLTRVQWDQASYDPQSKTVSLGAGQSGSTQNPQAGGPADTRVSTSGQPQGSGQNFRASDVMGMEVHLSDEKSFGEVEDVLINEQEGKASALLVDTWDGFEKKTYALPVALDAVNREDNSLTYEFTESDVVALQEYEER